MSSTRQSPAAFRILQSLALRPLAANRLITHASDPIPRDIAPRRSKNADGPRPKRGETAHPEALRWWKSLTPERWEAAVREFQICGKERDWALARTESQIIEAAARMWSGIARPGWDAWQKNRKPPKTKSLDLALRTR